MYQRQFETHADSFNTLDTTSGYKYPIWLPSGHVWRIDTFAAQAQTNYAAADTNYNTFFLYNSSGNAIASIANGAATGGLAIGPAVVTGVDTTMTSTYQYIDCSAATKAIYVGAVLTGVGRAMLGLKFVVFATPLRPGA